MYEFNPNITALKLGERSIVYALSHGVKLTDEEISAIVNFDKTDDDLQAKYHNSLLGDVIKMANTLAIKESQLEQK
jgi:hypothetical protein